MSKKMLMLAATPLLMIIFYGCQQQVDIEAEEAAIKAVNEKQMSAFIARDYEEEAEVWVQEPYIVHYQKIPFLDYLKLVLNLEIYNHLLLILKFEKPFHKS